MSETIAQLHMAADILKIPLRTLEQVKMALARARDNKADVSLARLMLRAGRLTDEARAYVVSHYGEPTQ